MNRKAFTTCIWAFALVSVSFLSSVSCARAQSPRNNEGGSDSWISSFLSDEINAFGRVDSCSKPSMPIGESWACLKTTIKKCGYLPRVELHFAPIWQYYLPVGFYEVVDQPFRSALFPTWAMKAYRSAVDMMFPLFYESDVKDSRKRAAGNAEYVLEYGYQQKVTMPSNIDDPTLKSIKKTVTDLPEEQQYRSADSAIIGGATFIEYRAMPSVIAYEGGKALVSWVIAAISSERTIVDYCVFAMYWGSPNPYTCHDEIHQLPRMSEDPGAYPIIHNIYASYIGSLEWAKATASLKGIFTTGFGGNPFGCGSGGPTISLLKLASKLLPVPDAACAGKGSTRAVFPPNNRAENQAYMSQASIVGIERADRVFRDSPAGSAMYKLRPRDNFEGDGQKSDKVQWIHNDKFQAAMNSCTSLEQNKSAFGQADKRSVGPEGGDDMWTVSAHWKYFRCCPKNYVQMYGGTLITK